MKRKLRQSDGFTLMEVLIAAAILVVAIIGLWGTFITSLNCIVQARELNIVADDFRDVFEKIKSTAYVDLPTVFPDGGTVGVAVLGELLLQNEVITVRYPNGMTDPVCPVGRPSPGPSHPGRHRHPQTARNARRRPVPATAHPRRPDRPGRRRLVRSR